VGNKGTSKRGNEEREEESITNNRKPPSPVPQTGAAIRRTGTVREFCNPRKGKPENMNREVNPLRGMPRKDCTGHNPLPAMARMYGRIG
jgi:hypothetical protein